MAQLTYLERGLTVLETRLQGPLQPGPGGRRTEVRPFITLGRETGAGATTIGNLLVPMLDETLGEKDQGWVFLDKNLLAHALARHQLPERLADYLPEDKISETKSVIGELMGMHPSIWQLEHQVAEAILQLAHVGRVVLAGRAAYLITQSLPGGFHVKLVAPLETRIPRMMALLGCDAAAAAAHIRKTDRARRRYVKTRFGRDIDDTHLYDLVINTERISPASAASLIVAALRDRLTGLREEMGAETRPAAASVAGR